MTTCTAEGLDPNTDQTLLKSNTKCPQQRAIEKQKQPIKQIAKQPSNISLTITSATNNSTRDGKTENTSSTYTGAKNLKVPDKDAEMLTRRKNSNVASNIMHGRSSKSEDNASLKYSPRRNTSNVPPTSTHSKESGSEEHTSSQKKKRIQLDSRDDKEDCSSVSSKNFSPRTEDNKTEATVRRNTTGSVVSAKEEGSTLESSETFARRKNSKDEISDKNIPIRRKNSNITREEAPHGGGGEVRDTTPVRRKSSVRENIAADVKETQMKGKNGSIIICLSEDSSPNRNSRDDLSKEATPPPRRKSSSIKDEPSSEAKSVAIRRKGSNKEEACINPSSASRKMGNSTIVTATLDCTPTKTTCNHSAKTKQEHPDISSTTATSSNQAYTIADQTHCANTGNCSANASESDSDDWVVEQIERASSFEPMIYQHRKHDKQENSDLFDDTSEEEGEKKQVTPDPSAEAADARDDLDKDTGENDGQNEDSEEKEEHTLKEGIAKSNLSFGNLEQADKKERPQDGSERAIAYGKENMPERETTDAFSDSSGADDEESTNTMMYNRMYIDPQQGDDGDDGDDEEKEGSDSEEKEEREAQVRKKCESNKRRKEKKEIGKAKNLLVKDEHNTKEAKENKQKPEQQGADGEKKSRSKEILKASSIIKQQKNKKVLSLSNNKQTPPKQRKKGSDEERYVNTRDGKRRAKSSPAGRTSGYPHPFICVCLQSIYHPHCFH